MIKLFWRLQYAYQMQIYMGIRWSLAWAWSGNAWEDWKGMEPRQAVIEDVKDWF